MAEDQPRVAGRFAPKSGIAPGATGSETKSGDGSIDGDIGNAPVIDPAAIDNGGGTNADGGKPRKGAKRGRKPGWNKSGNGSESGSKKSETLDINVLNGLLFSAHLFLAKALEAPEMALTETESKTLAGACANVAKHYDIGMTEKQRDWVMLCGVAGTIYGGRVMRISARKKQERESNVT